MSITRQIAVSMADDELFSMTGHLLNIDAVCESGFAEWRASIDQVRAALLRLSSDIEATRKARIQ